MPKEITNQPPYRAASRDTIFTAAELEFLRAGRKLARIATVGADGTPHVTPVGWRFGAQEDVIEVGGIDLPTTKKFRDVARNRKAAVVIDEVLPPWRPRGIEIRGVAEAITNPEAVIRIHAQRIISWGLGDSGQGRTARNVRSKAEEA
jgi:pyridoxamine 5'-phosphate oxidase family protein